MVVPYARGDSGVLRREHEFAELAKSAGAQVLDTLVARVEKPSSRYYIGSGKVDEIAEAARFLDVNLVLVDHLLTPVQERNLEKQLGMRVVDRAGLILDIFAQRARSHEGKLEVELAQLKHLATRVVRGWTHLDTQRGGAIGNRGPGETQLETDRRLLGRRVKQLTWRLQKMQTQRNQQRRARLRAKTQRIALVGYTNAGKSTLFNALTRAQVYAVDQLFATLDPTVRKLDGLGCGPVVLSDTVGFVRDLPHDLVAAFRGTLAEVRDADLLLHVRDAGDDDCEQLAAVVNQVLEDIGVGDVPQLQVMNKIDTVAVDRRDRQAREAVQAEYAPERTVFPDKKDPHALLSPHIDHDQNGQARTVWISATNGQGLELLREALVERLGGDRVRCALTLPLSAGRLHARLMVAGVIVDESVDDEGWCLHIDAPQSLITALLAQGDSDTALLANLLDSDRS